MAMRGLLADLVESWHSRGGAPVALQSMGGVQAMRAVQTGEPFDVIVLASDAIDRLVDEGHVIAGSRMDLVHSAVAIAVRHGLPHPSIADESSLRHTVLHAGRIAFSTGPSGIELQHLFDRWGLAESLRDRLLQAPAGTPVATLLAQGQAELGFQQLSELLGMPGIDVLGLMPPGAGISTTFSAALGSAGCERAIVQPLLNYLRAGIGRDASRYGMTPAGN